MSPDAATQDDPLADYVPVARARPNRTGWTADRQRQFLTALAESGCISEACHQAGITARSAYRLRAHPAGTAFAAAWDQALRFASSRLLTLAYERAVRGAVREQWRDDKLVSETREPSDKLLIFLLDRLAPWTDAPTTRWAQLTSTAASAGGALPGTLTDLADADVPAEPLFASDYEAQPIEHGHDRVAGPATDEA